MAVVGGQYPDQEHAKVFHIKSWIEELVGLIREDDFRSEDSVVQVAPQGSYKIADAGHLVCVNEGIDGASP